MNSIYTKYIIFLLFFGITDFLYTMDLTYITLQFSDNTEKKYLRTTLETSEHFKNMLQENRTINTRISIKDITADKFNAIYPLMELDIQKRKDYIKTEYENKTYLDLTDILQTNSILHIPKVEKKLIKTIAHKADTFIKSLIGTPNLTEKQTKCLEAIKNACSMNLYQLIYKNMTTVSDEPEITSLNKIKTIKYSSTKKFKIDKNNNNINIIQCSDNKTICSINNNFKKHSPFIFSVDDNFLLYCNEKNKQNKKIFQKNTIDPLYGYNCILVNLKTNETHAINQVIWAHNPWSGSGDEYNLACAFSPTANYLLIETYNNNDEIMYEIKDISKKIITTARSFKKIDADSTICSIQFYSTNTLMITKQNKTDSYLSIINLTNPSLDQIIPFENCNFNDINIIHNKHNNDYLIYDQKKISGLCTIIPNERTPNPINNLYLYSEENNILQKVTLPKSLQNNITINFTSKKNIFLLCGATNDQGKTEAFLYNYNQNYQISCNKISIDETIDSSNWQIDYSGQYITVENKTKSVLLCYNIKTKQYATILNKKYNYITLHPTQPIVFIKHCSNNKHELTLYNLAEKKEIKTYEVNQCYSPTDSLSKDGKLLCLNDSINGDLHVIIVATGTTCLKVDQNKNTTTEWLNNKLIITNMPESKKEKNKDHFLFKLYNDLKRWCHTHPLIISSSMISIVILIASYIIMEHSYKLS